MIVNCSINRVDVYRGYKLHIDFNFDYRQFVEGSANVEAAERRQFHEGESTKAT